MSPCCVKTVGTIRGQYGCSKEREGQVTLSGPGARRNRTYVEERQADDKEVLERLGAGHSDELARGRGRAASRDQVVDDKDGRALRDGVLLELERVLSVLKRLNEARAGEGNCQHRSLG